MAKRKFELASMIEAVSDLGNTAPEVRDIETITAEILTLKQTAGDAILGIGQRLIEAKEMLSHGEWLPWLTERVEFSERAAQRFMKLAREWSNPTTLSDLGASKALILLALPPEERKSFMAENHVINGEEKTVIDMTARELEQAIRERDEARMAAETAKADAKAAEDSRVKMETDMAALKKLYDAAQATADSTREELSTARAELEELKSKPVDVAVMAVDQEKLDQARAEAIAEMQAKVDKAKAARDKAEERRKTAEAALADANARLEAAARAEKTAAINSDRDLATFSLLFEQAQEITNRLHGILLKARGKEDQTVAVKLERALLALGDRVKEAAQ
ncbi:MAG: DUF3102 domain-containing protein [Oscillibacter sp.]|nr:DUF3102 domain-containing protein [Oscillibacter sp.]